MEPTWVLSAPGGPQVGHMNLVIRGRFEMATGLNNEPISQYTYDVACGAPSSTSHHNVFEGRRTERLVNAPRTLPTLTLLRIMDMDLFHTNMHGIALKSDVYVNDQQPWLRIAEALLGVALKFAWIPFPDSKVHGANVVPTWVLSAPRGPHVCHMNLVIRVTQ